jgi:hypothetical protein
VTADDAEPFVFEEGPPEAVVHEAVDGVAVNLAFACKRWAFGQPRNSFIGVLDDLDD